jgi:hypothetical protein
MLRRCGALAAAVVTLLLGCSGKPPAIARSYARVIYVDDVLHDAKSETLGVYLVASDPDGIENLSAFYVIDDDAELFWKVDKTAWESSTAEGESWIGASTLSMPGDSPLPSGVYRVVLQNVGGDTVEDTVTVPVRTVSALQASYPAATVQDGQIEIKGSAASYEVWTYAANNAFVASFPVQGSSPRLAVQTVASASPLLAASFTFRVFSWDERGGYGVLAGPYPSGALSGK